MNLQSLLPYIFAKTDPRASRASHIFSILCCPGDCLLTLLRQWILTFCGSWTLLRIWWEQWSLFSKNAQTQTHEFADPVQLWASTLNLTHSLSQTIPTFLSFFPTKLFAPSLGSHSTFFLVRNNNSLFWDFPDGTVVENLPASAGDTASSPGPGRSHMLRSN